jgi:hypothetical protein
MKNLLIVESKNDKFFFEAYIQHLKKKNTEVQAYNIEADDFKPLENGLSEKELCRALENIRRDVLQGSAFNKVGIILDQDKKTIPERLELINSAIKSSFEINEDALLTATHQFQTIQIDGSSQLQIGFCLTHVAGKGELETVLKVIKTHKSQYADCLNSWQECLKKHGINKSEGLKPKDFDKFWVQVYIRYDTCKKDEQGQADRKCCNEAAMQKPIWDFDHECLTDFKQFLECFD